MDINILMSFLIAIAIGTLIGIERQRGQKTGGFAGIRTFIFISFLGALTGFIFQEFEYQLILPVVYISIFLIVVASYVVSAMKGYFGMTAEISAFLTFFLGFIVMFEEYRNYALVFSVVITIILSFKSVIHKFIMNAKDVEWNDTLKFALIAFVILPLLPEKIELSLFNAPYESLNVFYPREAWILVVFVSAVSFVGYFLVKIIGTKRGTNLIGAIGGIVSSTAVTQSMADYSKSKVDGKRFHHKPLVTATLLASLVAFIRVGVISLGVNKELYPILLPLSSLIILGSVILILYSRSDEKMKTHIKLQSPLKLKPALMLGGLYFLLTFVSKLSFALNLGKSGIVITSIITGFFDIDPVILSVSSLSVVGAISVKDAISAILLAVASNNIMKASIALSSGSRKFGKSVAVLLLWFVIWILLCVFYIKSLSI